MGHSGGQGKSWSPDRNRRAREQDPGQGPLGMARQGLGPDSSGPPKPGRLRLSEIGDELAAGRALSDLGHALLVTTASDIHAVTDEPVTKLH